MQSEFDWLSMEYCINQRSLESPSGFKVQSMTKKYVCWTKRKQISFTCLLPTVYTFLLNSTQAFTETIPTAFIETLQSKM